MEPKEKVGLTPLASQREPPLTLALHIHHHHKTECQLRLSSLTVVYLFCNSIIACSIICFPPDCGTGTVSSSMSIPEAKSLQMGELPAFRGNNCDSPRSEGIWLRSPGELQHSKPHVQALVLPIFSLHSNYVYSQLIAPSKNTRRSVSFQHQSWP